MTISETSYFRVLIDSNDVNIDIILKSGGGTTLAGSQHEIGKPEGIVAQLSPGQYSLQITSSGAIEYQFCRTFYMTVSIVPQISIHVACPDTVISFSLFTLFRKAQLTTLSTGQFTKFK